MKIKYENQEITVKKNQAGRGVIDRIFFVAKSKNRIINVGKLQEALGYHPAGYDGPWNIVRKQEDGEHITTWKCSASCD